MNPDRLHQKPERYTRRITSLARLRDGQLACTRHRARQQLIRARLQSDTTNKATGVVQLQALHDISKALNLLQTCDLEQIQNDPNQSEVIRTLKNFFPNQAMKFRL